MTKFSIGLIVASCLFACSPAAPEGPADAGAGSDSPAQAGACTVTLSGAVAATTSCIVASATDDGGLHYTLSTTDGLFAFAANLPGSSLTTGTFPLSATTKTAATVDQGTAVWAVFYDDGEHANQGDATFTITDVGQQYDASNGVGWLGTHGTLTATAQPADQFATGAVTITATF